MPSRQTLGGCMRSTALRYGVAIVLATCLAAPAAPQPTPSSPDQDCATAPGAGWLKADSEVWSKFICLGRDAQLRDKPDFATYPEKSGGRRYFVIESHFFAAWSGSMTILNNRSRAGVPMFCGRHTCGIRKRSMSALIPEADMCGATVHVCFRPIAEIRE